MLHKISYTQVIYISPNYYNIYKKIMLLDIMQQQLYVNIIESVKKRKKLLLHKTLLII